MTGWHLLLALLPSGHEVGSNTHSPTFRDWKPEGERNVAWAEYWTFTRGVFDLCLARVAADSDLWPDLASKFDGLPAEYLIEALDALDKLDLEEESTRVRVWQKLDRLWRRHREYVGKDWAMSADQVAAVERVARAFQPTRAAVRHAWLFRGDLPDLGTRRGTADYERELARLQSAALDDVWREGGLSHVEELAHEAKSPSIVGWVLGRGDYDVDPTTVAQLVDSVDDARCALSQAFVRARHREEFPRLQELAATLARRPLAQARIYQLADDVVSAWAAVAGLGKEVDDAYWREFYPYGRGADFPFGVTAARHLAEHGRLAMALDVLAHYRTGTEPNEPALVVRVFRELVRKGDPEIAVLSAYDINNLMSMLRESPEVDEDTVAELEWALLPVLDSDPTSSSLQRRLARSPEFFIEVLSLIYRSDDEDPSAPTEARQKVANNAWRLLKDWKVIPGGEPETAEIDSEVLERWVLRAQELADDAGRREVADLQIGESLARSRVTHEGTWPPAGVVEVLEKLATDSMLRGFRIGAYNKRGVTSRGLADGGRQEYALAKQYRTWATRWKFESPKTARLLRELADDYDAEGRRHDDDTQRFQEGFGLGR